LPKKAEYRRRRESGVCVECPNKPEPGLARCASCRAKTNLKAQVETVESLVQEYRKDCASLTSKSPAIRTLEDLLAVAKIDLTIWEVDRHEINQWQIARKATDSKLVYQDGKRTGYSYDSGGMNVEPLWQVKAWLKRRTPLETALASLLGEIHKKAPTFQRIKRPKLKARRSLELSIMDPHIGLLCGRPEADGTWDLDIVAAEIMACIDDLVEKASVFGPFEQVFCPFGNDFVHSDDVFHRTTAGTLQPESISWHKVYQVAEQIAIKMVERLRQVAPVTVYEVPGNHSRMADYTLARLLKAYFRREPDVTVDASTSPYKFHRYGCNLIGYEHGHSISAIRLAALMANERPDDWAATTFREWHLGDQHRKGSSKPSVMEEQGVSVEYIPGLTVPNEWHRLKGFNHQKRGAMAFVWDYHTGPIGRLQFNGKTRQEIQEAPSLLNVGMAVPCERGRGRVSNDRQRKAKSKSTAR